MTNIEKYNNAFIESFSVEEKQLSDLKYQSVAAWDSVGHMALMAMLEEAFDIMMETDDIIDFSSYKKGSEILKKYENKYETSLPTISNQKRRFLIDQTGVLR